MEKTIWKFELSGDHVQQVEMPDGAAIVCLQLQGGSPCIWAMVNPEANRVKRTFEIFGTGHPVPEATRMYVGTYQIYGGSLVFHVFELLSLNNPTKNKPDIWN